MKYLAFLLVLNGCASHEYYTHLWCRQTTEKMAEFAIYMKKDGKLVVQTYDAKCAYVRFEDVEVKTEK